MTTVPANQTTAVNPFNFEGHKVRSVLIDGKPFFVARDVADALGYKNVKDAIFKHCKGGRVLHTPLQTSGGIQNVRVIDQGDVVRLVLSSRLPSAQAFERWIMEEVIPSVMHTGSYSHPSANNDLAPLLRNITEIITVQAELINKQGQMIANLGEQIQQQNHRINSLELQSDAALKRMIEVNQILAPSTTARPFGAYLTDEEKKEIEQLWNSGLGRMSIAKELGIKFGTVRSYIEKCHKNGTLPHHGVKSVRKVRPIDCEQLSLFNILLDVRDLIDQAMMEEE